MAKTSRAALLVGVLGAAACQESPGVTPDGSPPAGDAMVGGPGLVIPFTTKSPVPGSVGSGIVVSRALFRVANLRVIGDSGPGDTRTSRNHLELEWKAGTSPSPIEFSDAPSGLYSKVSMELDGETVADSFEITGTVELDGTSVDFRIHDPEELKVSMDASVALDPGKRVAVNVQLDIDKALDDLEFSELPTIQGSRVLGPGDRQMSKFRGRLKSAFSTRD